MRRVSMGTRDELMAALAGRYGEAGRIERGRILDEFVAVTGYHRKHAMRVLRSGPTGSRHGPRPGRRIYGEAVRAALILLWEASDRVCGKRLKALLPVLSFAHWKLAFSPTGKFLLRGRFLRGCSCGVFLGPPWRSAWRPRSS
jgi:hypothetical protein